MKTSHENIFTQESNATFDVAIKTRKFSLHDVSCLIKLIGKTA